jgi:hypothetical protein
MSTRSSPNSSRSVAQRDLGDAVGSQAPLPTSSFVAGTPKRMTPPTPHADQRLDLLAQRLDRVLELAGQRRISRGSSQSLGDEERRDEVARRERGLGDEARRAGCVEAAGVVRWETRIQPRTARKTRFGLGGPTAARLSSATPVPALDHPGWSTRTASAVDAPGTTTQARIARGARATDQADGAPMNTTSASRNVSPSTRELTGSSRNTRCTTSSRLLQRSAVAALRASTERRVIRTGPGRCRRASVAAEPSPASTTHALVTPAPRSSPVRREDPTSIVERVSGRVT